MFFLECVAHGEKHLMALVADAATINVGIALWLQIGLEGIERTIGAAVLIGDVEIHFTQAETETGSDAVGALPVDEV